MAEVIWSSRALKDLAAIRNYIARDNPEVANTFAETLRQQTERLELFPDSGLITRQTSRRTYRTITYQGYVTLYYHEDETCHILRVIHGRRRTKWRR